MRVKQTINPFDKLKRTRLKSIMFQEKRNESSRNIFLKDVGYADRLRSAHVSGEKRLLSVTVL